MRTLLLIITLGLLFISCEEKHDLKINLTQGKTYKQTVLTESSFYQGDISSWADIKISTFYKINYKVVKREDSIFTLSCNLKEMKIEFDTDFNTQTIHSEEKESGNPMDRIISNMIDREFFIVINERGKVKQVKDTDNLYKNLFDGIPQISEVQKQEITKTFKESFNDKTFKNNLENGFYMIPSEEVALKESWKNNFKTLPADPKIVSFYITDLSSKSKVSTLKRRLASISVIHKLKGHYIDIKHPLIIENLMGIQRKKGVFQKSKNPILINELKEIINIIDKSEKDESKKARDKALILIGFSGGFRRSELVNIDFEDLEFTKEGVKIFIKRSKTDQSGEGMIKAIPYFKEKSFCPVIFLKQWIAGQSVDSTIKCDAEDTP